MSMNGHDDDDSTPVIVLPVKLPANDVRVQAIWGLSNSQRASADRLGAIAHGLADSDEEASEGMWGLLAAEMRGTASESNRTADIIDPLRIHSAP